MDSRWKPAFFLLAAACLPVVAQTDPHAGHSMPGMSGHEHMDHGDGMDMNESGKWLMRQSSGTSFQPPAWPMPMLMTRAGSWNLMWMAQAFVVDTQQSGDRGADKLYSANWGMLSAIHKAGKGSVMLRSMVSLDPLTITNRRYPLLFQTGESAYGVPLVDAQHPHEFLMELSVQYARPVGERGTVNAYYAPVGEAALGPTAYPHRASAMELPQAALAHHWEDSTHIANNVLTAGVQYGAVRLEGSGFRGREPNENRWNVDMGAMDSWSARLSVFASKNWMAQVSGGHLTRPEELHPGNVDRMTASVHYIAPRDGGNYWATSLIWARNYKSAGSYGTHAVTAETVVPFRSKNFVTGRFEWSQRDELFENDHALAERVEQSTGQRAFDVAAYTIGYTRDVARFRSVQAGLGVNASLYGIERALQPYYGEHPWGVNIFLRVRLKPSM